MILRTMRKASADYEEWSDEEIVNWLKMHQTDRGNLSFSRIGPVSSMPDIGFGVAIALFIGIGALVTLLFASSDQLWTPQQFATLAYFDFWPLAAAVIFGLYSFGHRFDTVKKYRKLKKVLESRQENHG